MNPASPSRTGPPCSSSGCHTPRHIAAGVHGGGGHCRQHRDRIDRDRKCAWVPYGHRHAETQSQEKKDALKLLGAQLILVPAAPYKNPNQYVRYSERLAEALAKNRAERRGLGEPVRQRGQPPGPYRDTVEEIWAQTDGKVDGFVSAVGSGGTLGGVSIGLKAKRRDIQIALADVPGAALYSYYTTGELKSEGSSITEGIGQGRITKNLEGVEVDKAYLIPDAESVQLCFQLLQRRRPVSEVPPRVNVAGAIRLAARWGPGTPS